MKVINEKDYLELKLIINYNIQHRCWGLVQKASSKMYVFTTVTLHMSISKRCIQWTFVMANMTSNKFPATSNNFHSPIILDNDNSYNILWYIKYCFLRIPCYINKKPPKKQVLLSNLVMEQCFHFWIWRLFILNVWVAVIFPT